MEESARAVLELDLFRKRAGRDGHLFVRGADAMELGAAGSRGAVAGGQLSAARYLIAQDRSRARC